MVACGDLVFTMMKKSRSWQRILLLIEIVVMKENTASAAGNCSRDDKHGETDHGFGVVTLEHKINTIGRDREGDTQELKEATYELEGSA